MLITVKRTGGFAGVREELGPVDTDTVQDEIREAIEAELGEVGFWDLPSEAPPHEPIRDGFDYEISIVDDDRNHSVSFDDRDGRGLLRLFCLIATSGAEWRDLRGLGGESGIEWLRGEAWYNRMPKAEDKDLHVAGVCRVPSSSIELSLEPGNAGINPQPGVVVLRLIATSAQGGDDQIHEREVSWSDYVGSDAAWVHVGGAASASMEVRIVQ